MSRKKRKLKSIALERVKRLLDFASKIFKENPELAHRYAEMAWKLKTRYNLKLPKPLKLKICRKCQKLWVPGKTCRVRLRSNQPYMSITCLNCGYIKRIPYKNL